MILSQRTKKGILYFGGAFIILLGGAIILMAPYHAVGYYVLGEGETYSFSIWEGRGYHEGLEIALSMQPGNVSAVQIDIVIRNNATAAISVVNFTLTIEDILAGTNPPVWEKRAAVDLDYGDYTIRVDRMDDVGPVDMGFTQLSDSRTYIIIGGSLNILGLIICAAGYCISGQLIPSDERPIIDWGYEMDEELGES